jgi:hypothetical protein
MQALLYVAAALTALWGIAHLCATRGVVRGFGELTADNRRIITMEWIVEGAALVSMGALVAFPALPGDLYSIRGPRCPGCLGLRGAV